ncbi:HAMP domain-containing sensor histidine kinase [Terrarubrum flagellatum]|uniref:sensor histidine kinase n=1 Tax=Terrirubrum flagellatum TaxID=2895980 RepID=UPI0031455CB1
MWLPIILSRLLPKPDIDPAAEAATPEPYAALGDVVARFDAQANVVSASGDTQSLFGVSTDALGNDGLFVRIHISDRPAFLKAVSDACHGSAARSETLRVRRGGATREIDNFIDVEMRCAPHKGGCVAVLRDVSDARAREDELARAKADAEASSVAKDRFLATISHELRTPLNAIIGFSEILGSEQLGQITNERRCEYAKIIRDSGEHLLEIVNMLLDMSKLESGTFEVEPETFDLRGLLNGVCDMMGIRAAQAEVDLQRDFAPEVSEIVSDRRACRQILINLVNNAVKFTPAKGVVTVRAARVGGALDIVVEDTGVGIAVEDLPRLGNPFFQARSSYDRPYEGTGLGLSVVRRLAGLLGGAIVLESGQNLGTTVTVRLPLDGRAEMAPGAVAPILTVARTKTRPGLVIDAVNEPVRLRA